MGVLSGRTALVTGAGRGIGRACALRLARDGAFVIVHYGSSSGAADALLAEIEAEGGAGFTVGADLGHATAIAPMFAEIDARLAERGRDGIDILVNNAGIAMQRDLTTITPDEFDQVMAVNLRSPLFVAQAAAERMGAGGRIINITSEVGRNVFGGWFITYGATKAALDYMTAAMAVTLGPRGITVNAVAPGAIITDFIGDASAQDAVVAEFATHSSLGEAGRPEHVANIVALVASPDSKWITGESIRASGGARL